MQRVIERKLYDTDRAEQIAQHAPNTDRGDFYYLIETLYKTSGGEYFLHGEGGAATKYAKPCNGAAQLAVRRSNPSTRKQRWTGAKNAASTVRSSSTNSVI